MGKNKWLISLILILSAGYFSLLYPQFKEGKPLEFTFYHSIDDTTSIETILTQDSLFKKQIPSHLKNSNTDSYWLKIDFTENLNTLEKDTLWFLFTRRFFNSTVYFNEGNILSKKEYGYLNRDKLKMKDKPINGVFFNKNNLIDGQYLLLKIKNLGPGQKINKNQLMLFNYNLYYTKTHVFNSKDLNKNTPVNLFIGAFLFIFLFSLITYFTSGRLDFLFYSLFILSLLLYLGKSAFGIEDFINREYTLVAFWTHSQLQIFINLFYVAFAKHYLNTSENYPKLDKAIHIVTITLTVIFIVTSYTFFNQDFDLHLLIMNLHRLFMSLFALAAFIYLIIYAKNALAYFILFGSLAFLTGSLIMLFTMNKNYMIAGATLEVLLFGLGLNYKLKMAHKEKLLLEQTAFENKISALRAQMNPHFIFNSLSSIQHLVLKSDTQSALKYLSKFSQLMRSTLENSIEKNVTLAEEIKLLETYLDLESLRFDDSFSFEINVEKHLNTNLLEVPLLIIQPFVENAILHGLLHKNEGEKKLVISFSEDVNHILATVEDNGIGRKASKALYEQSPKPGKISRGIELTEKRIEILKTQPDKEAAYLIEDLTDNSGNPTGTKVTIKIPKN